MGQNVGIMLLGKIDPRRTAGGEKLPLSFSVGLEQFSALFHDNDVCGKIGIKNDIRTNGPEGRDDLSLDIGSRRQAELLAEADTDGRSELKDGDHIRVIQIIDHGFGFVLFAKRPVGQTSTHCPQLTHSLEPWVNP